VTDGWSSLDDDVGNTNGPAVLVDDESIRLVVGDTIARIVHAYDYDPVRASVSGRRDVSDHSVLGGAPDGATVDATNGVWSCVVLGGKIARLTEHGVDRVLDVPVTNPSDVAFGGPELATLFMTSIALDIGGGPPGERGGRLLRCDDVGVRGRPEPRLHLA
jgi:sugar lactone lactonase YvrE